MHHVIADGWSASILANDAKELYAAHLHGKPAALAPLKVQFADYAHWQRLQDLSDQLAYWTNKLAGYGGPLDLTAGQDRRGADRGPVGWLTRRVPAGLAAGINRFGRDRRTTLFTVLLTGLAMLAFRRTRRKDLCLATTVAGRDQAVLEPLIGFFINILPLRIDLAGNPTGDQLLDRVRQVVLDALNHSSLPFERLIASLPEGRQEDGASLLPVTLRHQNFPEADMGAWAGGLKAQWFDVRSVTEARPATGDLDLQYFGDGRELEARVGFDSERFDAAFVHSLLEEMELLLGRLVERPEAPLSQLIALSSSERASLDRWNATTRPFETIALPALFARQVERRPDAIACHFDGADASFSELDYRSDNVARALSRSGIGRADRIALYHPRSTEFLIAILAILKVGCIYVPVDPAYPPAYVRRILDDARPSVILASKELLPHLADVAATVLVLDPALFDRDGEPVIDAKPRPDDIACIAYTSGSTGRPKGVMIEHRQVLNCLRSLWMHMPLAADEVLAQKTSPIFVPSMKELLSGLLTGVPQVILPDLLVRDTPCFAQALQHHRVTRLYLVPSHLSALLDHAELLGNLRDVVTAGEPLSQALRRRFEQALPSARLHNNYGCTELNDISYCSPGDQDHSGAMVPAGRPIANVRLHVLDEDMQPLPPGVAGSLFVEGASVGPGYWDQPELNLDRFVPNPFGPADSRLMHTGDRVRWLAGGRLEYLGREDFQIKIHGQSVDPVQVELELAAHPAISRVAVVGHSNGTVEAQLIAYYDAAGSVPLDNNNLHAWLRDRLPGHMVPSRFIALERLPQLPNGKLDRRALMIAAAAVTPSPRDRRRPATEGEQAIAAIWAELLDVPVDDIGLNDNFFAVGGDSMLAIQLVERMRRQGLHIEARALFGAPTLASIAAAVSRDDGGVEVPPNPIPRGCERITSEMLPLINLSQAEIDGIVASVPGGAANIQDIYPLAPLQEGVLFHHLMVRERDVYLMPTLLAFDHRERLTGFIAALQAVIVRHDILRTSVAWQGLSQPAQVVWREAPLPVVEVELDPADGDAATQLRARVDAQRYRLDVGQAPLLRAFVAHDGVEDRWLLLLLHHHLVVDRAALDILVDEVGAHLFGKAERLAAPAPFRNFVAHARLGTSEAEHEGFFRSMLRDVGEPVAPFGLLDVRGDGSDLEEAQLALAPELAVRLRERARTLGISAASLFHLAWGLVVARTSGRGDAVFGTVLFGRMQSAAGADRAVGMFINTLPIRIAIDAEGAEASARRVQALLAKLLRHEHASLAFAQRCSGVPAPAPLFTALLNYRYSNAADVGVAPAWEGVTRLGGEQRNNYPVTLVVDDQGKGFILTAQTGPTIAAERMCGFMNRALAGLADALERTPEKPVCAIDVLSEAERRRLLKQWNATAADYPHDKCVHELFEAQVMRTPDSTAVEFDNIELSYAELNTRANQIAHHLRGFGVKPDDRVAICVESGIEMVVGLLGIFKAGGAYVPLDPAYPAERLAYMLGDSAPVVVLTLAKHADRLAHTKAHLVCLDTDKREIDRSPETVPISGVHSGNLAYVIYTSGSTGWPKGVMVEHRSLLNYLSWALTTYRPTNGSIVSSSYAFDATITSLFTPLLCGGAIRLLGEGNEIIGVEDYARGSGPCGLVKITPAHLEALGRRLLAKGETGHALGTFVVGGESLPLSTVRLWRKISSDIRLVNEYGPTETVVGCTIFDIPPAWFSSGSVPIGRPVSNTRIYVPDGQGQPVPVGTAGELYIGGAGVARGYLNRPDLTAERFLPDPFGGEPGARMYRTGDLGRFLADGNIEFLGRNDSQVKVRGFRIELGEIAARLTEHAVVCEAVVVLREDSAGEKQLVAYVVCAQTVETVSDLAGMLRAHLAARLPDHMVPPAYVRLSALPLTPNTSWTGARCQRPRARLMRGGASSRRGAERRRYWRRSGRSCSRSSVSAGTTIFSNLAAIRCWRSDSSVRSGGTGWKFPWGNSLPIPPSRLWPAQAPPRPASRSRRLSCRCEGKDMSCRYSSFRSCRARSCRMGLG